MLIAVIQCIGYTIGPVVPVRRSNKGGINIVQAKRKGVLILHVSHDPKNLNSQPSKRIHSGCTPHRWRRYYLSTDLMMTT